MSALVMRLKTSQGVDVTLRAGRDMDWPDGARMDWVRMVNGEPEVVTATLALEWSARDDGVEVDVGTENSTPWDGFLEAEHGHLDAWRLNYVAFVEWSHSFCAHVNKALADTAALTPFADLHWHEVEAARLLHALPRPRATRWGETISHGDGSDETAAEVALRGYVRDMVIANAERESQRTAATQCEEMGGKHEEGSDREAGLGLRSVPVDVLEQAVKEMKR